MIKKTSILALVIYLSVCVFSPSLIQAGNELVILDSSAQAEFPSALHFNLSAQGDADITDVRLRYTVDRLSYAQVTSEVHVEFIPSTIVNAEWTWDMRRTGGLPSGSSVDYWWLVKDANGNQIETAPARVQFDDNRYLWHSLTEGKINMYWYEGDESFARELMTTAHQVLDRLSRDTGAHLEKPARLYIYARTADLRGAMISPQEWTGGAAFTRYSAIAIGIAPGDLIWGKGAIAHELAHLVVHQMTFNPYGDLPTWLNEGLAMYAEGILKLEYVAILANAISGENLISVRSLSSPFSAYAKEAALSYAQSYSLVEFLISNYGQDKMLELLNTFRQGSTYDAALDRVYGFDMDGLDDLWRKYVIKQYQPAGKKAGSTFSIIRDISFASGGTFAWSGLAIRHATQRQG